MNNCCSFLKLNPYGSLWSWMVVINAPCFVSKDATNSVLNLFLGYMSDDELQRLCFCQNA